jgi:hypothetical protein
VEDMDLAVRVGLKGWKFIYVGDVKVSYSTNVVIGFSSLVKLNLFVHKSTLKYALKYTVQEKKLQSEGNMIKC